ncbi:MULTISPECIES: hypothetical protein [unclassified Roseibium]|uniref:hypothetical protein n=1 Tax=unclassified Roseibium TaxID=2629323 RepID=UPI00273D3FCF|nr:MULTISPECIES: hypothetical protein [unclassified Roseibium]
MQISEEDIGKAITGIMRSIDAEYEQMTEADLASRWHFKFDPERSMEANMYLFYDYLALYAGSCRRWEERHNGNCCVVERVRDKYVMPKIREFAEQVRALQPVTQ